jgi:methylenetetrahydrofolate--tRNA-(uracil-5-)-methyltransferase
MLGALYRYLWEADPAHFQPMNANFGLLEELVDPPRDKAVKRERYAERALRDLETWRQAEGITPRPM